MLNKAEAALDITLRNIPDACIQWPSFAEQKHWAELVQAKEEIVTGRFGFIDGKNYRVMEPNHSETQNAMYNGWLHAVLVTNVTVWGADGTCIGGKLNFFGSRNDSTMSETTRNILADPNRTLDEHGLIADTAFPVSDDMFRKIREILRVPLAMRPDVYRLSNAITSLRQACEWGQGCVEKVFRILLKKLPWNIYKRGRLLRTLYRLYNFRVRVTGISQIRNYFGYGVH